MSDAVSTVIPPSTSTGTSVISLRRLTFSTISGIKA
jgi:hypothetical protein